MKNKALLSVAAGAGLIYFLTTPKGQSFLRKLGKSLVREAEEKYSEGLSKSADKLKDLTHKVAQAGNG